MLRKISTTNCSPVKTIKKYHNTMSHSTVCPKVPENSNVPIFSAKCGWILKPFDLQVAHIGGFDLVYKEV